jgi:hypothetical protein
VALWSGKNSAVGSQGSRVVVPYSNIAVSFSRSLTGEMLHVRLQFLDLDPAVQHDADLIAESLLRGHYLDVWEHERFFGNILWSKELGLGQDSD